MPRHWKAGDVYAPHDLSPAEMRKWRSRQPPKKDVMDLLGANPLDMYKVCLDFFAPLGYSLIGSFILHNLGQNG